jgi:DNA-binding response OmpR family regulator
MNEKQQDILVVEDEASIASFVGMYLKNAGYSVRRAATGGEAITQVASQKPDLIVLDLETRVIEHGDLVVDAGRREVRVGDEEIQLAPKEFDLLWELLDHRGLVLTRDQLLERVWGYTFAGDTRTVDVHVRQIRRKLGDASPIVTVWGVGYKVASERSGVVAS